MQIAYAKSPADSFNLRAAFYAPLQLKQLLLVFMWILCPDTHYNIRCLYTKVIHGFYNSYHTRHGIH